MTANTSYRTIQFEQPRDTHNLIHSSLLTHQPIRVVRRGEQQRRTHGKYSKSDKDKRTNKGTPITGR